MRYSHPEADKTRATELRAAVFIDYENLFTYLYGRIGSRGRPDETISEMLDEFRRYLIEEVRAQTSVVTAYADFGEMHGSGQYIQRSLYLRGIEPRFVPMTLQKNAAEIQLTVDAVEAIHNRPDLQLFVIVTGDRTYLPLVQQFKQSGRLALIAMLAPPPSTDNLPGVEADVFLNASNLLSDASRRALSSAPSSSSSSAPRHAPQGRPQPVEYREITNAGALQALEIIEEHFGQYEEVYLTPLLRKLSELLDEDKYDPKTLISELEEAGAVWLEKRRGFPYDYTVLLIDAEHPDVEAVQKRTYERPDDAYAPPYDDDLDEADDYYPDDDDDLDDYDDEYVDDDLDDELDDELDDYDDEEPYSNGAAETDDDVLDDYTDDYPEEDYAEEGDEEPR